MRCPLCVGAAVAAVLSVVPVAAPVVVTAARAAVPAEEEAPTPSPVSDEIGRASCRERVYDDV